MKQLVEVTVETGVLGKTLAMHFFTFSASYKS
jgi:hypothetical protein